MEAPPSQPTGSAANDAAPAAAAPTQACSGGSSAKAAPAYRRTPSIEAALAAELPEQVHGVLETTTKTKGRSFHTQIRQSGTNAAACGLTRQQAAAAHDLVVTWRLHAHSWKHPSQNNTLNFPAAGYSQDEALLAQLRTVDTAFEMRNFMYAVLKQQASAAAVGAAAAPAGSRKRKQRLPARLPQPAGAGGEEGAAGGQEEDAQRRRRRLDWTAAAVKDEEGEDDSLPPTRPVSPAEESEEAHPAAAVRPPGLRAQARQLGKQQQQQQPGPAVEPTTTAAAMAPATPCAQPATSLPQVSPGMLPLLAGRAAEAAQHKVEQAVQAFVAADREAPSSMLRPLQHLLRALDEQAGDALQEVVAGWAGYSLARQQEVFDAALSVAAKGAWGRLEGQLSLALALTNDCS